jgi:hypothetical protein
MDPLCDPLITRPIQTGWEFTFEPYPSGQFGYIDDLDHQFGNSSVWTRTRTRSDGLEPLLTLVAAYHHLTRKIKSYVEDFEWNVNEIKEMVLYLVGVVPQSLLGGNPAQCPIFNLAIQCTRALLQF